MDNYYQILGVNVDATQSEIKSRYRFLSHAYHPDKFPIRDQKLEAEDIYKKVNEAYEILSDPAKRSHFDKILNPPIDSNDGVIHEKNVKHDQNTNTNVNKVIPEDEKPISGQQWIKYLIITACIIIISLGATYIIRASQNVQPQEENKIPSNSNQVSIDVQNVATEDPTIQQLDADAESIIKDKIIQNPSTYLLSTGDLPGKWSTLNISIGDESDPTFFCKELEKEYDAIDGTTLINADSGRLLNHTIRLYSSHQLAQDAYEKMFSIARSCPEWENVGNDGTSMHVSTSILEFPEMGDSSFAVRNLMSNSAIASFPADTSIVRLGSFITQIILGEAGSEELGNRELEKIVQISLEKFSKFH